MEKNFKNCEGLDKLQIEINSDTVIRISFSDKNQVIKELEILKVVGLTKTAIKLSNGITVSKRSLFPYHRANYNRDEEYYLLEHIKVSNLVGELS